MFGWRENFNSLVDDWALLRIDRPLGEVYGYLGWRQLDLSNSSVLEALQNQVWLAGYSGDYPPQDQRDHYRLKGEEMDTAGIHLECSYEAALANTQNDWEKVE